MMKGDVKGYQSSACAKVEQQRDGLSLLSLLGVSSALDVLVNQLGDLSNIFEADRNLVWGKLVHGWSRLMLKQTHMLPRFTSISMCLVLSSSSSPRKTQPHSQVLDQIPHHRADNSLAHFQYLEVQFPPQIT